MKMFLLFEGRRGGLDFGYKKRLTLYGLLRPT
jgi:hypothetical protein